MRLIDSISFRFSVLGIRLVALLLFCFALQGCAMFSAEPGIGGAKRWSSLKGWREDNLQDAWRALQAQCAIAPASPGVAPWCEAAQALPLQADSAQLRDFFENRAAPHRLHGAYGKRDGLITGYYEPLLQGALQPTSRYRFPLYAVPEELLVVELAELFPELEGKRVRGRVVGDKLLPFYARADIDSAAQPLVGQELFWVDDAVDAFFLQIQGSGVVQLPDGTQRGVAYAQQNGHPYRAIGRDLIEQGEIAAADVSLFSIKDWLQANPAEAQSMMNRNASYVFFRDSGIAEDKGPEGSLGVPLTEGRSVAVDRRVVPLGSPLWLDTTLPDGSHYRRLVFAQDTGGAIAGPVRADVFFGRGEQAASLAGAMKQAGQLFLLKLKD